MEYNNSSLSDTIHHLLTTYLDPKTPQAVRDDYMVFLTDRFSRSRIEMIIENWSSDAASFDMFYSHLIAMYRANAENAKERDKKLRSIPHFDVLANATRRRVSNLTIPDTGDFNQPKPSSELLGENDSWWEQSTRYDLVVEQLALVETKSHRTTIMDFFKSLLSLPQQHILRHDLQDKINEIESSNNKGPKTLSVSERVALMSEIEVCFSNTEGKSRGEWAEMFVNAVEGMSNSRIYETIALWSKKHRIMDGYSTWSRLGQPLAKYRVWQGCGKDDNDKRAWNKAVQKSA